MKRCKMALRVQPIALLLALAPLAHAGGPALSGLVAEADTAETQITNPAGMSRLKGTHMTVQGMMISSLSSFKVDESKTTIDGGDPDKGGDPIVIPSIYYVRQLNEDWHAGLSLTIPSGFGSNYGGTWAGRYQTVDFSLVYISLSPSVSYRINDNFSVGLGVSANYTSEASETKIVQPFQEGDGKLKSDLDGIGVSVTLSALYEFSEHTRIGLSWTSDADADLEGKVKLRNLDPLFGEVAKEAGITNIDTEITNTLPQRLLAGIYHQFDSGNFMTLDALYVKFSDFSVSDLSLNGEDVDISTPDIFNDIWAVTAGMGFPVDSRTTYKIGAFYLSQPVDDEDRTFSMRIDSMWGVGAGVSHKLTEERTVDLNLTVLNTGEAPVDTESALNTRVVGESDDPYAIMAELTYHF